MLKITNTVFNPIFNTAVERKPPFIGLGSSVDPDAATFITANQAQGGTLSGTDQSAVNTYVLALKGFGLWSKIQELSPLMGGTAASCSLNLKDPRALTAAFQILWTGSPSFDFTGVTFNGTSQFGDTQYNSSVSGSLNDQHIALYSRTQQIARQEIDMGHEGNSSQALELATYFSSIGGFHATNSAPSTAQNPPANSTLGLFQLNRQSSNAAAAYLNGVAYSNVTTVTTGLANENVFVGARSGGGAFYSSKNYSLFSIGTGFSATDAANFYTATQAFMTARGIQV